MWSHNKFLLPSPPQPPFFPVHATFSSSYSSDLNISLLLLHHSLPFFLPPSLLSPLCFFRIVSCQVIQTCCCLFLHSQVVFFLCFCFKFFIEATTSPDTWLSLCCRPNISRLGTYLTFYLFDCLHFNFSLSFWLIAAFIPHRIVL